MAIYKMLGNKEGLEEVKSTSFGQEGVLERQDLQRILRDQPDILEEGLFVITEEFSNWQGSGRSIDLLAIDQSGRLVVIELKRGETGEHMDLQAIRYAAMVSTITLQQTIDAHRAYLNKRGIQEVAEEQVRQHLETTESGEIYTAKPRIILVSEGFSSELTTCAMWLNDNGLDVACIRMKPHRTGELLLLETSQIIPLPEVQDYLVRVREKEEEQTRKQRSSQGQYIPGADAFKESIATAPAQFQSGLYRIHKWVTDLEREGLVSLTTWSGENTTSLQIRSPGKSALALVYVHQDAARLLLQASNLRNLAPNSVPLLSKLTGKDISTLRSAGAIPTDKVSNELLAALSDAYREANGVLDGDTDNDGES